MAFRYIMENTLKKYKLENLNPFSGSTYKPLADNDETFSVISSSCPRMIPDGFTGLFLIIGFIYRRELGDTALFSTKETR